MFEPIDTDSLAALPIFPLPHCVLLPGALLPLHVFEPRYRELTRDALAGSRLMGIARLCAGFEADYESCPPVHPHLGVGRIIASEELDDGRYHLLLRGLCRARIEREDLASHPYRRVRARVLEDAQSRRPTVVKSGHVQLIALCDRLSMSLEQGGEQLRQLVRAAAAAANCVDLVTAALVTDTDDRQILLESLDPADRIELAVDFVSRLIVETAPCTGTPN
jgi:Lon protease-like protein